MEGGWNTSPLKRSRRNVLNEVDFMGFNECVCTKFMGFNKILSIGLVMGEVL